MVIGLADQLELVTCGITFPQFKGIYNDLVVP
jgi:hypothetical protein